MKLNVGLIGCGRLGRVYARDLASRIPETRLAGVTDPDRAAATQTAEEFGARAFDTTDAMLADRSIDAVVIVSPTHTHKALVLAAAAAGKPAFCEKPLALSLAECREMQAAVERTGTFFQMGFMRRFDPGYVAAKRQIGRGTIGRPVVFKPTSRDPFPPKLEYLNPASAAASS
jgi:myo-inositol 2-dehydrogenase/D-chiro-inositol 1-dehydrogenase